MSPFDPKNGDVVMMCHHLIRERIDPQSKGALVRFGVIKNPPKKLFPDQTEAQWCVVCAECATSAKAPDCVRTKWKDGNAEIEERKVYA